MIQNKRATIYPHINVGLCVKFLLFNERMCVPTFNLIDQRSAI